MYGIWSIILAALHSTISCDVVSCCEGSRLCNLEKIYMYGTVNITYCYLRYTNTAMEATIYLVSQRIDVPFYDMHGIKKYQALNMIWKYPLAKIKYVHL